MITGYAHQFGMLNESVYRFHLTGSRAFGYDTQNSDWDFFVADTAGIREYLLNNGYQEEFESYKTATAVYAKGNIHIQVVPDFELKLKVQNHILSNAHLSNIMRNSDKTRRKCLWQYLLENLA